MTTPTGEQVSQGVSRGVSQVTRTSLRDTCKINDINQRRGREGSTLGRSRRPEERWQAVLVGARGVVSGASVRVLGRLGWGRSPRWPGPNRQH